MDNTISNFANWVTNNPYASLLIFGITILGLIVSLTAFIMQIKDKSKKLLCYSVTSNILVENRVSMIEGVEILHNGTPVDSIVVSVIEIWNGGNVLLNRDDFYYTNGLQITWNKAVELVYFFEPKVVDS